MPDAPPLWCGHSYTVVGCKTTSIGKHGAMRLGSRWLHVLGGATGPLDEAGWLADGMHLSRRAGPGTDADAALERRMPGTMT